MDLGFWGWLYTIALFSLGIIMLAIPIAAACLIYRFIRRKCPKYRFIGILLIAAAVIFTILSAYFAFYPRDRFFVKLFEESSGTSFPAGSTIIEKDAPYPDIHGDFTAAATAIIPKGETGRLLGSFSGDAGFSATTDGRGKTFYSRGNENDSIRISLRLSENKDADTLFFEYFTK